MNSCYFLLNQHEFSKHNWKIQNTRFFNPKRTAAIHLFSFSLVDLFIYLRGRTAPLDLLRLDTSLGQMTFMDLLDLQTSLKRFSSITSQKSRAEINNLGDFSPNLSERVIPPKAGWKMGVPAVIDVSKEARPDGEVWESLWAKEPEGGGTLFPQLLSHMSFFVWPAAADMSKHTHMAGAWDWCDACPPKQTISRN